MYTHTRQPGGSAHLLVHCRRQKTEERTEFWKPSIVVGVSSFFLFPFLPPSFNLERSPNHRSNGGRAFSAALIRPLSLNRLRMLFVRLVSRPSAHTIILFFTIHTHPTRTANRQVSINKTRVQFNWIK